MSRRSRLSLLAGILVLLLGVALAVNQEALRRWWYGRLSETALLTVAREHPQDRVVVKLAGDKLLAAGRFGEAREILAPVQQQQPEDVELAVLTARACWRDGDTETAGRLFDALMKAAPDNARARYWAAEFLYDRGHTQTAEEMLLEVTRLAPENGEAWTRLGEIALVERKYAEALTRLDQAERLEPNAETARLRASVLHALRRRPEAEAAARLSLQRGESAEAHRVLAQVLSVGAAPGPRQEARDHLKRAVELDPTGLELLEELALAHRALGENREAVRVLRRLVDLAPSKSRTYLQLSQAYRALQRPALAAACRRIYQKLEPAETRITQAIYLLSVEKGSVQARLRLARAYLDAGRSDLALKTLEEARGVEPDNSELRALLPKAQRPPSFQVDSLPPDPE